MIEYSLQELLPQRPPFLLISRLVHCDWEVTETEFAVEDSTIFCQNGILREPGIIENIAQTCAARMGYLNKINEKKVKIGFIGALKDLQIYEFPKIGKKLNTRIEVLSEIMELTLVKAEVQCQGRCIASCEMKIAVSNKEDNE